MWPLPLMKQCHPLNPMLMYFSQLKLDQNSNVNDNFFCSVKRAHWTLNYSLPPAPTQLLSPKLYVLLPVPCPTIAKAHYDCHLRILGFLPTERGEKDSSNSTSPSQRTTYYWINKPWSEPDISFIRKYVLQNTTRFAIYVVKRNGSYKNKI